MVLMLTYVFTEILAIERLGDLVER
jgi:hypothetical protein